MLLKIFDEKCERIGLILIKKLFGVLDSLGSACIVIINEKR